MCNVQLYPFSFQHSRGVGAGGDQCASAAGQGRVHSGEQRKILGFDKPVRYGSVASTFVDFLVGGGVQRLAR